MKFYDGEKFDEEDDIILPTTVKLEFDYINSSLKYILKNYEKVDVKSEISWLIRQIYFWEHTRNLDLY